MSEYYPIVAKAVQVISQKFSNFDPKLVVPLSKILNEEAKKLYVELQRTGENVNVSMVINRLNQSLKLRKTQLENTNSQRNNSGKPSEQQKRRAVALHSNLAPNRIDQVNGESHHSRRSRVSTPGPKTSFTVPLRFDSSHRTSSRSASHSSSATELTYNKSKKIIVNVIRDPQSIEDHQKKSKHRQKETTNYMDVHGSSTRLFNSSKMDDLFRAVRNQKKHPEALVERVIIIDRPKIRKSNIDPINEITSGSLVPKRVPSSSTIYSNMPSTYYQSQSMIYPQQQARWYFMSPYVSNALQYYPYFYYSY